MLGENLELEGFGGGGRAAASVYPQDACVTARRVLQGSAVTKGLPHFISKIPVASVI